MLDVGGGGLWTGQSARDVTTNGIIARGHTMDKGTLDVDNVMTLAAAVVVDLPTKERAGRLLYLLELVDTACQERGDGDGFSDCVMTVFLALSHRLTDGAWKR